MGKSTRVVPLEISSSDEQRTIINDKSGISSDASLPSSSSTPSASSTSAFPSSSSLPLAVPLPSPSSSSRTKTSGCCTSFFGAILHGIERIIVSCIRALPSEFRYVLTLVAFWPTVWFNRWYCYWFPHRRQLWNRIHEYILLSSVPLYPQDVQTLYKDHNVRAVVNMCREWNDHDGVNGLYKNLQIEQLYLPTIDFDPPTFEQLVQGVEFVKKQVNAKRTVVIHCKAGRGRSVALCLAYFVCHEGLSPEAADAHIRAIRPHISSKWRLDVIQAFVGLRNRVSSSLHHHHHYPSSNHNDGTTNTTTNDAVVALSSETEIVPPSTNTSSTGGRNLTKRKGSSSNLKAIPSILNDKDDSSRSGTPSSTKDDESVETRSLLVVRAPL